MLYDQLVNIHGVLKWTQRELRCHPNAEGRDRAAKRAVAPLENVNSIAVIIAAVTPGAVRLISHRRARASASGSIH
jgi:hypothetical protein